MERHHSDSHTHTHTHTHESARPTGPFSGIVAFGLVSFFLGELGDGLNIFQGIYLVNIGWNESAIGIALSLMGFTALVCQTFAGDLIDRSSSSSNGNGNGGTLDRRKILSIAATLTACSALAVLFVKVGNQDHSLMYITKVIEGVASSFIAPCLAALTLANYGGEQFDHVMANNLLWGHIGSALSAILAGVAAYVFYPNIKSCFYVIGISALCAVYCVGYLPEGDVNMGRGLVVLNNTSNGKNTINNDDNMTNDTGINGDNNMNNTDTLTKTNTGNQEQEVATYIAVLSEPKTLVLGLTGFFFHLSNANVLLVLGELMSQNEDADADGQGGEDDYVENYYENATSRSAIPLIAGAILLAQATMTIATYLADYYTNKGMGRKILFTLGLMTLPIRCALLIYWKDAGNAFLLSTQILDGLGGGLFNIVHPFLVADITFGTGRFNLIMGLTASCFGFGATLSNLLGQHLVEHMGHVASLAASLIVSFIPIAIFTIFMPETLNTRGDSGNVNGIGDKSQHVATPSTTKNDNSGVLSSEYHQLA